MQVVLLAQVLTSSMYSCVVLFRLDSVCWKCGGKGETFTQLPEYFKMVLNKSILAVGVVDFEEPSCVFLWKIVRKFICYFIIATNMLCWIAVCLLVAGFLGTGNCWNVFLVWEVQILRLHFYKRPNRRTTSRLPQGGSEINGRLNTGCWRAFESKDLRSA